MKTRSTLIDSSIRYKKKQYINNDEIHLFGINRSGIHAITYWLLGHYKGPMKLRRCANYNTSTKYIYYFHMSEDQIEDEKAGILCKKHCLFFTHEDQLINGFRERFMEFNKRDKEFAGTEYARGNSKRRYVVHILRDPFNHFASIMEKYQRKGKPGPVKAHILFLWRKYAMEALGERNALGKHSIFINYNSWFSDKEYRQSISKRLDLPFTDRWLNKVTSHGSGSSFSKQEYNGKAQQMDVMDRWKEWENDKQYRELLTEEVRDFSKRIFNFIPF